MRFSVISHPNAKNPRVEKDLVGMLYVYVSQPPLEGKANRAIIEALAQYLKVKKGDIILLSGHKSKNKLFEVIQ